MRAPTNLFQQIVVFVLSACVWIPLNQASVAATNPPLAFVHVNVIPMDHDEVLEDQTVIVQDGKIAEIGPAATLHVPRGGRRIESKGKYLIPGLTDAHVHLQTPTEFPLFLANGVTTVFNLDGRPAHLLGESRSQTATCWALPSLPPVRSSPGRTLPRKRSTWWMNKPRWDTTA
jgi:hypothetical protein